MINTNALQISNAESPFTELFAILKNHEIPSSEFSILPHNTKQIKMLSQHTENAINVLLQGLQNVGQLLA